SLPLVSLSLPFFFFLLLIRFFFWVQNLLFEYFFLMELEPISSCCSTSSSGEDAAANMTELEAAEALADLAQLAVMREQVFESAASWGSKGKRVRKRVKTESPPADSETLPTPDLAEERAVKEEGAEPISREVTEVPVKTETNGETPKPNLASTLRCNRPSGCGRSRQNLSEAEREERRIRRILANRESARQTIRRRQAMCEELSKKAADLAYENENLRRETDWALKEFQSLETINKHLKEQVAKSVKPETKEPEESPKPSQVEMSTSSTTPFYFYNQNPYQLFCWPHVTQPSNPMVSPLESQNGFTAPFTTSEGASAKAMTTQENGNPGGVDNGQKTHFYVVPCPWFLPAPTDQSNGVPFTFEEPQRVVSSNGHHTDDSSTKPVEVTKTLTSIKEENSGSTETRPLYDLNESAAEVLSEEGDGFPVTTQQQAFSFKREDVSDSPNGVTPPGHRVLMSLPGKKQGSLAAAEARKRRKELTKLKNLHGRQCRMQV
uniref:BZIP domain-containing protein n=2 Tax=Brassica oleracea var. oleracea TaxID=109376 RepID=A0A0D3CBJ0_BRAOL